MENVSLDENVRRCQDVEVQRNCTVQKYVQTKTKCGCVPLSMNLDDEDSICKWPKETICTKNILNETFLNIEQSTYDALRYLLLKCS